jgi:hypothetical protein
MKNIKILTIFALANIFMCTAYAMEKLAISYTQPFDNGLGFEIDAKNNDERVGYIYYKNHNNHANCAYESKCNSYPNCWEITLFNVYDPYKKQKIGLELFKQCVTAIRAQKGENLVWEATPINSKQLSLETLIAIYKKIAQKVCPDTYTSIAVSPLPENKAFMALPLFKKII